jgi:hypothetical protein
MPTVAATKLNKPAFIVGVSGIKPQLRSRIVKSRTSFAKADAMRAQIGFGFAGIPGEAHDRSLST